MKPVNVIQCLRQWQMQQNGHLCCWIVRPVNVWTGATERCPELVHLKLKTAILCGVKYFGALILLWEWAQRINDFCNENVLGFTTLMQYWTNKICVKLQCFNQTRETQCQANFFYKVYNQTWEIQCQAKTWTLSDYVIIMQNKLFWM